jgi:hypothetical protein
VQQGSIVLGSLAWVFRSQFEVKEDRMKEFITRVTADRLAGEQPGMPRAIAAAAVAGTVTAVVTYRLLRR